MARVWLIVKIVHNYEFEGPKDEHGNISVLKFPKFAQEIIE